MVSGDGAMPLLAGIAAGLGAAAAWLTGRAIAESWRPVWQVLPSSLLSGPAAIVTLSIVLILALCGYRLRQVGKMVSQYPWLYRRAGPFFWRDIGG